jgi:hypothetical protein
MRGISRYPDALKREPRRSSYLLASWPSALAQNISIVTITTRVIYSLAFAAEDGGRLIASDKPKSLVGGGARLRWDLAPPPYRASWGTARLASAIGVERRGNNQVRLLRLICHARVNARRKISAEIRSRLQDRQSLIYRLNSHPTTTRFSECRRTMSSTTFRPATMFTLIPGLLRSMRKYHRLNRYRAELRGQTHKAERNHVLLDRWGNGSV